MNLKLATQDEGVSALLAFVFSGAIGSPEGKGVSYALAEATATSFSWVAALEDMDGPPVPIDRYLITFNRLHREILAPKPIVLSNRELADAVLAATGQHLASSARFTDGALSISYKITVQEHSDIAYILQLCHHGRVASMDSLIRLISTTASPQILLVPAVYPIPGEMERQEMSGMGRQITQFIPGVIASSVYPQLSHKEKLVFLPRPCLIGEVNASQAEDGKITLQIGPDRHHGLGGPFSSVREYLGAYIRSSLDALKKQQGIEEYKAQFLNRTEAFLNTRLDTAIPSIVEDIPVVATHADMGPHNVILSSTGSFVSSAPYASQHRIIEMLFRKPADNGFGAEYEGASELRAAFWGAIPDWERWNQSEATRVFLEWFRFGLFMKPEWRPSDLTGEEKGDFWRENIRAVEDILTKYSIGDGAQRSD
ncbi:uncharacterized protein C8A04DRAFT_36543 [Dichotomopilus funicola]|uniref:Aminoglycoside phosphotransferase domain-containing protein n=1 Tax=Dichotomopilus funicola TaxID=1934379 RepID=A0AAN6ZN41_9PEZI|nr:hypothetical protein C8A04DRAFT_36543 [Dichotomopilus funicola]